MKKVLIPIVLSLMLAACGQGPSADITNTAANDGTDKMPVSSTVTSESANTAEDASSETSDAPDLSASGVRCWPISAKLESTDTTIVQYRVIMLRWYANEPNGCSGYKYTISRSTPTKSYIVGNAGSWIQQPLVTTTFTLKIKWKNRVSKRNLTVNVTPYR
jgi:hypothetical protein